MHQKQQEMLELIAKYWGLPLWAVCPGAEPHVRRRYISLQSPINCFRCLHMPRGVVGVRLFLDFLFFKELACVVFFGALSAAHLSVLCYTLLSSSSSSSHSSSDSSSSSSDSSSSNSPVEGVVYFRLLLLLFCLSFVQLCCCCFVLGRAQDLRFVWFERPVEREAAALVLSLGWQIGRLASCCSSCVMFAALQLTYNDSSSCCSLHTPLLCRYMSVLLLCFLSLLGPCIVFFAASAAAFVCCFWISEEQLAVLFHTEAANNYSLPLQLLRKLKEQTWAQLRCMYTPTTSTTEAAAGADAAAAAPSPPGVFDAAVCSICLCDYQPADIIRTLPCGHVFHSICITRWFKAHASCPLRCSIAFAADRLQQQQQQQAAAAAAEEAEPLSAVYLQTEGEQGSPSSRVGLLVTRGPTAAAAAAYDDEERAAVYADDCVVPCLVRSWSR